MELMNTTYIKNTIKGNKNVQLSIVETHLNITTVTYD